MPLRLCIVFCLQLLLGGGRGYNNPPSDPSSPECYGCHDLCDEKGTCTELRYGASWDGKSGVQAADEVKNVPLEGCCGLCATTSSCNYWSHSVTDCSNGWVCNLHQKVGKKEYGPDHSYGEVKAISKQCWSEKKRRYIFDAGPLAYYNNSDPDDCCARCASYVPAKGPHMGPGCTYWVLNTNTDKCELYDNGGLVDVYEDGNYTTGYLSLEDPNECAANHGLTYLGTRLFAESAHPVSPAQCCHLCKTTCGCKAWTWSLDGGLERECIGGEKECVAPIWMNTEGGRGVCQLRQEKGHEQHISYHAISGC